MLDARKEPGRERCGLVLGERAGCPEDLDGIRIVREVVPARNVHPDPRSAYEVEAEALFHAHRRARDGGPEVLGVYHSHPEGAPVPSSRDKDLAWSGYSYLIFARPGPCRCWRLVEGRFLEERWAVGDGMDD